MWCWLATIISYITIKKIYLSDAREKLEGPFQVSKREKNKVKKGL